MEAYVKKFGLMRNIFIQPQNGKRISAQLKPFPRLLKAMEQQRNQYELWNDGNWIHGKELDEDLSAEAFLKYQQKPIPIS